MGSTFAGYWVIRLQEDIERGTLIPPLTAFNVPPLPVQFVFPPRPPAGAAGTAFFGGGAGATGGAFDDWQLEPMPLFIAFPPNRHISAKLRVFMDWAVERLRRTACAPRFGPE